MRFGKGPSTPTEADARDFYCTGNPTRAPNRADEHRKRHRPVIDLGSNWLQAPLVVQEKVKKGQDSAGRTLQELESACKHF